MPATARLEIVGAKGPLSPRKSAAVLRRLDLAAPDADALKRHLAIEQAIAGTPLYAGNRTTLLRDGRATFPAMFAAIRASKYSVYLEYYTFQDVVCDGVHLGDLLRSKREAGVDVAVIYDSIGSSSTPGAFFDSLKAAGVRVLAFHPVNPLTAWLPWKLNERDHRKILIADDRLAIIGGINLSTEYEDPPSHPSASPSSAAPPRYWRDTDLQIEGPAVAPLLALYRSQWADEGGPPLAADPAPGPAADEGTQVIRIIASSPDALAARYYATVLSAINAAQRAVWLSAAYFVPTRQEKRALRAAARRGVDVELLLPSQSDSVASLAVQRSSYGDLLEAGVRIFERDGVILHSKTIVIDGVWSIAGSSNFDHRSVLFNDEVDAVVLGTETAKPLEELFRSDLRAAHEINAAEWAHRSWRDRLKETFWRVSTALL